jgi:hypothetical protein
MRRTSLFLTQSQVMAFRTLAQEQGRSWSELIREALDEYLRVRGKDPQVGAPLTPSAAKDEDLTKRQRE